MRTQWKKAESCKQLWHQRWSWLLDERKKAIEESDAIRQAATQELPDVQMKSEGPVKSLKPVPVTSTGVIGWLASKPECQLEIYTSWIEKPPIRLPDVWENPNYMGKSK